MAVVTHLFKTYFPDTQGGLEEAIRQIGKYAVSKGYDVRVVSISQYPNRQRLDGIECVSYSKTFGISTMPISLNLWRDFKKIIAETDILQIHSPYPFAELLTLFNVVNKPCILTFHAPIIGRDLCVKCYSPFYKSLLKKVDAIVPTSKNLAESTLFFNGLGEKIYPINLWLDQSRFCNLQEVDNNFRMQVDSYGDFALFVGVLRSYKGLDVLLDAAKRVSKNIIIVGKGPRMSHLEKRIKNESIKNVYLLGYQSDDNIGYLLKRCLFFVLPSNTRGECFGQVLLEASYYHKAMISTELGTGTSFVNKDNYTGFVIPPNDELLLAEKMNYMFDNMETCLLMGENAYKRYETNFTEEIQGEKYISLYEMLLRKYSLK